MFQVENISLFSPYSTGKNFDLDTNPIEIVLNRSIVAVQLGDVRIKYLNPGEGSKSFILGIANITFVQKQGQHLSLDQGLNNCLFIHRILNQTEVVIINNDSMSLINICIRNECMYMYVYYGSDPMAFLLHLLIIVSLYCLLNF